MYSIRNDDNKYYYTCLLFLDILFYICGNAILQLKSECLLIYDIFDNMENIRKQISSRILNSLFGKKT